MSIIKDIKYRNNQKKANNFIASLKNKSEKEIEQAYLDNKEFENNEIVLSYLFFNHTSLIRILPLDFQVSRINSNLNMFYLGSEEAKKELVSSWINTNKFFINALVVGFSEEEYSNYLKIYFKQPKDIKLLFMDDLKKVIEVLSKSDLKETEKIIENVKDELTDKQWEYILEVNPIFIKYANQNIQNRYTDDEKFIPYIGGEAREKYIDNQIEKIKEDFTLFDKMPIEIQKEYIYKYPFMINYLEDDLLTELLKYDIELIKYVNLLKLKNKQDKTQEVICSILENIENKSNKEIVNILVNKCVLNAKGKLYRFDPKSNDISYQYTKRIIKILQDLSVNQIVNLINVDVNYIMPYVIPVYNDNTDRSVKEKAIIDANSRCLNVFKVYFGEEYYQQYYKVINKIYNEYLAHIEKYDYEKDYRCLFELFKVLFNKNIITKNTFERVSLFIGMCILYKDENNDNIKIQHIKVLNELLNNAYETNVKNNREIFNISSLELFDKKLSFIDENLLLDYSKYNFVNISNLLLITKSDKMYELFKNYYEILIKIYGLNKETLYRIVENFTYYKDIMKDINDKDLDQEETENLILLLSTFSNQYNICKKEELKDYDLILFKNLVNTLSVVKDENIYKNILCNYLYNKGYDENGNTGWLETETIKSICDIFDSSVLEELSINDKKVFDINEINLFRMTKLLFTSDNFDIVLSFVESIITNKLKRNILSIIELFNKIKKYRIELINYSIVSLNDIEDFYNSRPDIVIKNMRDGVEIYTIIEQDFKVLTSTSNDGITYNYSNISELQNNSYAYNKLIKDGSIRLSNEDGKTIIKVNKDKISESQIKPDFIILSGSLTDELLDIAKSNNLTIVEVQN